MVFKVEENLEKSRNGESFEEALKRTMFGKFHYLLIVISGLVMANTFFEMMSVNYALPVAECDLEITSKQQYGIISGLWFAGSTSTIFAYLGEFIGSKNRSRSIMISSVVFGVFSCLLPVMAWLIINQNWSFVIPVFDLKYKPWRLFFLACGFPSLVAGLTMILFPESPKFTFSQGDENKTLEIFRTIYYFNSGKRNYDVYKLKHNEEFGQALERRNVSKMMLDQLVTLIRDHSRSIATVSMLQFMVYFVCNGLMLFFPDILNEIGKYMESSQDGRSELCEIVKDAIHSKRNVNETSGRICVEELDTSSYLYVSLLELFGTFEFLMVGLLVNYIGRLTIFTAIYIATGVSVVSIIFVTHPVVSMYLYVMVLLGGVNNTLLNTVTYDLFPTHLRSLAMSLSLMMGRLGSLTGGNVAGFLLEQHCSSMFTLSGIIMFICGALTFLIPNIKN